MLPGAGGSHMPVPSSPRDRTYSDLPPSPRLHQWPAPAREPSIQQDVPTKGKLAPAVGMMAGVINTAGSFAGFSPPEKVKFIFNYFDRWARGGRGGLYSGCPASTCSRPQGSSLRP
jgi:hypothetical protein